MKFKYPIIGATIILTILTGCSKENGGKNEPSQTQSTGQTTETVLPATQAAQEELTTYVNKDLGITFSYPKSWGKAEVKHLTFDANCATSKTAPNIDVLINSIGPLTVTGATSTTCSEINAMGSYFAVYKNQKDFDDKRTEFKNGDISKIVDWKGKKLFIYLGGGDGAMAAQINTDLYNPQSKYGSILVTLHTPASLDEELVKLKEDNKINKKDPVYPLNIEMEKTNQFYKDMLGVSDTLPQAVKDEMQKSYDVISSMELIK